MLATVLMAAAFGMLAGVLKGNDTGLRGELGNLSAPWLLVAAVPALRCGTLLRGARVGLVSTVVALAGFYASLTLVLAGHLGSGGYLREFLVEAEANRIYFLAGLVTGPLFGAIGAALGRRQSGVVGFAVGGLFAGEVIGVALLQGRQLAPPPLYFRWGVDDWTPYVAEALLGLAIIIVAAIWRGRVRTSTSEHSSPGEQG
jgi:hypothetical protein